MAKMEKSVLIIGALLAMAPCYDSRAAWAALENFESYTLGTDVGADAMMPNSGWRRGGFGLAMSTVVDKYSGMLTGKNINNRITN
jgi:hypothetical protein